MSKNNVGKKLHSGALIEHWDFKVNFNPCERFCFKVLKTFFIFFLGHGTKNNENTENEKPLSLIVKKLYFFV